MDQAQLLTLATVSQKRLVLTSRVGERAGKPYIPSLLLASPVCMGRGGGPGPCRGGFCAGLRDCRHGGHRGLEEGVSQG